MAAGLVRVVVLLCAVAAVTRAQTWHSHGKPSTSTIIWSAMAPLTHFEGKKWFGVGDNGNLYERYQDTSGTWHWVDHGKPSGSDWYDSYEPCAFEGEDKLHLTAGDGYLYERYWAPTWTTVNYGPLFGYNFLYASGCSSVYKPGFKYRTFMRGAVGQGAANGRHGRWPCFSPPNRFVRDCSDPFYVGGDQRSMFCITDDDGASWTAENRLYQLTVGWDPATATWVGHGIPASNQYYYVDRPNVAFLPNPSWPVVQTPRSVFVPSTEGVYELRIP
uniref:Uncharacterized protein n=1 Tax=Branchiostoma floridae TaxID=7739 RepID=C3ZDG8_BRAFL|eukprot:XP_002592763.1 hypothetical protein BRAFLDRAFT_65343 [Branchiostoma floridae]